jgi:hypothetical protein
VGFFLAIGMTLMVVLVLAMLCFGPRILEWIENTPLADQGQQ